MFARGHRWSASVPNIIGKYRFICQRQALSSSSSKNLHVNSIFKIFALYSIRSDANKQTRPETFLFFKYIILVQSYRYIHRIINNIYKNIKHNIYDYKIKRELFTLNICTKLWTIAGGVTGGLNIKVGPHMLSRVTSTRRQPVDQKKKNRREDFSHNWASAKPSVASHHSNVCLNLAELICSA